MVAPPESMGGGPKGVKLSVWVPRGDGAWKPCQPMQPPQSISEVSNRHVAPVLIYVIAAT